MLWLNMENLKQFQYLCVFLGRKLWQRHPSFFNGTVPLFTCTRPNRSRVGAIDKPDRTEKAFEQYDIPEDPEKNFTDDFSIVGHEKMIIFGDFISNFTYWISHLKIFPFVQIFVDVYSFANSTLISSCEDVRSLLQWFFQVAKIEWQVACNE